MESTAYDAVVSGLVLNFIPDVARGIAEMVRAVRPSGTVAAYVWDYAGKNGDHAAVLGRCGGS